MLHKKKENERERERESYHLTTDNSVSWQKKVFKLFVTLLKFTTLLVSAMVKNLPANAGNDNPLQYSCLDYSMDKAGWQATVHGVAKSQIRLSD